MKSSGSPSRLIGASLSDVKSDDSTRQSVNPQEKMLFSKIELLPCNSMLLLFALLLLLLLLEVPASQYWTPLISLTQAIEEFSGGGRLTIGLKAIEVRRTELGRDGIADGIVLELNSEFISKGRQFWLNQRTEFVLADSPTEDISLLQLEL